MTDDTTLQTVIVQSSDNFPRTEAVVIVGVGLLLVAMSTAPWAAGWVGWAGYAVSALSLTVYAGLLVHRYYNEQDNGRALEGQGDAADEGAPR